MINAVIHRDYCNQGRDIKVGVYDNIVNIVSPGGFPNSLTAESLTEGRSEIRNRVVARIFKELGFIEQWGSGIQRIKNICTAHGLVEPRIREKGDFVDVEFYRPVAESAGLVSDTEVKPADTIGIVPDTTEKVSDTGYQMPDIRTITDNVGRLPADSDRIRPIAVDCDYLSDDNRIIIDSIGRLAGDNRTITEVLKNLKTEEILILCHLLRNDKVNRKEVKGLLDSGKSKAHACLSTLMEKGLIERKGQGRSTYYVIAIDTLQRVKI